MTTPIRNIAIFLCDLTGVMAIPWVEAGYQVILVDPQHADGSNTEGPITKVGNIINSAETWKVLRDALSTGRVAFVAGFPPCTDVAVSGTPWFAAKAKKDPQFQAKAALVAEQCRVIGQLSGAPWFFENPVSVFSSIFGKPQHTFHPFEFTAIQMEDNYTKRTCIWSGGGFVMPAPQLDRRVAGDIAAVKAITGKMPPRKKAQLLTGLELEFYPDDRVHKCPPGAERANIRSATPEGFARAVFLANHPHHVVSDIAA